MTETNPIPQAAKPLCDLHCHLGFLPNAQAVAASALQAEVALFANSVTPAEWAQLKAELGEFSNVTVGFGMHPWWVGQPGGENPAEVVALLREHKPKAIGEIGLDFGPRHADTAAAQKAMLWEILRWAGANGGHLLCLHAVHGAGDVYSMLQESGALESCRCLFHWFTGPSDLLKQAVQAGCYFSCGPRMLATGKGREYVKAIPPSQLVLETDAPPWPLGDAPFTFEDQMELLVEAAEGVAAIKGPDALVVVRETSLRLLRSL